MNDTVIGKCSLCGGHVVIPGVWAGTVPPKPTCSSCGGTVEDRSALPVIPMTPRKTKQPSTPVWEEHEPCDFCGRHVDDCGHGPFWSLT